MNYKNNLINEYMKDLDHGSMEAMHSLDHKSEKPGKKDDMKWVLLNWLKNRAK